MDYFINSYRYIWKNLDSLSTINKYLSAQKENDIKFEIPRLICQGCYGGDWQDLFEVNTITRIYRTELLNGVEQKETRTLVGEPKENGANSIPNNNDSVYFALNGKAYIVKINNFSYDRNPPTSFDSLLTHGDPIAHASLDYDGKFDFKTDIISEDQVVKMAYKYDIEVEAYPDSASELITYYSCHHDGTHEVSYMGLLVSVKDYGTVEDDVINRIAQSSIKITTSTVCKDMTDPAEGGPFLIKGEKYSCYQLLRKAMLTIDTQIINNSITGLDECYTEDGKLDPNNIQYPIIVGTSDGIDWNEVLKTTKVYETVLETKNLWEVLLQIKKYIHAEPHLSFADDGTDRLLLTFRQLGSQNRKTDTVQKITIFNSSNISDYFSSFDAYVSNFFSPQNEVEEWIVPKTNDSSFLVSNDTAILETSYQITEISEFDIKYGDVWKNAFNPKVKVNGKDVQLSSKIFENDAYQILTSNYRVSPSKADSLYYTMGDKKIQGLNYVPPSQNNDQPYALKKIVRQLFGVPTDNLKFNELMFHIKYKTQDTARITQIRPNIEDFMKVSKLEKYPHHEQYFGQQEKIIDSERFGENLFGRLIACGNAIYQTTQYFFNNDEYKAGDLYEINNSNYYVFRTENEYYNDGVFQKAVFSKDYNEMSQVCGIPSENRVFEIMPTTTIRREKRELEFLSLSTTSNPKKLPPIFLNNNTWMKFIKFLIFNDTESGMVELPNFAYLKFMADIKRFHNNIDPINLYPSTKTIRVDDNTVMPIGSKSYADCIVPLLHYPKKDSLVFEWDMETNFKAGDQIDEEISGVIDKNRAEDSAYFAQQPIRYVDVYGRADLYTFRYFKKDNWTISESRKLPEAIYIPTEKECNILMPGSLSIGLDKDCREEISGNFQINLVHRPTLDDVEDFITYPNLFGSKRERLRMCLCNKTKGMFELSVDLSTETVIADNIVYELLEDINNQQIIIKIEPLENLNLDEVKSIVLYELDENKSKNIYITKNVSKLENNKKLQDWYIYPVFNEEGK